MLQKQISKLINFADTNEGFHEQDIEVFQINTWYLFKCLLSIPI